MAKTCLLLQLALLLLCEIQLVLVQPCSYLVQDLSNHDSVDHLMLHITCLNETSVHVTWYPVNEPPYLVHLEYRCFNTASAMDVQLTDEPVVFEPWSQIIYGSLVLNGLELNNNMFCNFSGCTYLQDTNSWKFVNQFSVCPVKESSIDQTTFLPSPSIENEFTSIEYDLMSIEHKLMSTATSGALPSSFIESTHSQTSLANPLNETSIDPGTIVMIAIAFLFVVCAALLLLVLTSCWIKFRCWRYQVEMAKPTLKVQDYIATRTVASSCHDDSLSIKTVLEPLAPYMCPSEVALTCTKPLAMEVSDYEQNQIIELSCVKQFGSQYTSNHQLSSDSKVYNDSKPQRDRWQPSRNPNAMKMVVISSQTNSTSMDSITHSNGTTAADSADSEYDVVLLAPCTGQEGGISAISDCEEQHEEQNSYCELFPYNTNTPFDLTPDFSPIPSEQYYNNVKNTAWECHNHEAGDVVDTCMQENRGVCKPNTSAGLQSDWSQSKNSSMPQTECHISTQSHLDDLDHELNSEQPVTLTLDNGFHHFLIPQTSYDDNGEQPPALHDDYIYV